MGSEPSLRVLVVDNNEPVCAVTAEMLESLRADCETDSLGALKVFSENPDKFDFTIIEPLLPEDSILSEPDRDILPPMPWFDYKGATDEDLKAV
jgi:CheY-like chemotaxis protein